uniref:Peptidase S1 domain-containing protein n=1 Tax=Stomoxys calcitrans TaxID=35570 RepID=A0A1I8PTS0_STOCA
MLVRQKTVLVFVCLVVALASADIARRHDIASRDQFFQHLGKIKNAPFSVQLRNHSDYIVCAGTLISPQHVLTAAHCFDECKTSDLKVVAGASSNTEAGVQREISQLFKHDEYNPSTFHNDVAVLKLDSPMELSETVEVIKVCSAPIAAKDEFQAVVGWLPTKQEHLSITSKMPVMLQDECIQDAKTEAIEVEITNSMVCNDPRDRTACSIVAGGAAMCAMREVCGIVVGGSACKNEKFSGVYTNVYEMRDFIEKSLKA